MVVSAREVVLISSLFAVIKYPNESSLRGEGFILAQVTVPHSTVVKAAEG